ncbi:MAG: PPK2 family polyphosphate kinase [Elusimicrobiota bacterium]
MKRNIASLLAAIVVLGGLESRASVARVPVLRMQTVPAFRGPVIEQMNAQLKTLLDQGPPSQLLRSFQSVVAPAPAAATPEAFAARAAIVQALAAPESALPDIVRSLDAAGGRKAAKASSRLRELGRMLDAAQDEGKPVIAAAAALNARFDGATAAPGEAVDLAALPTEYFGGPSAKKAARKLKKEVKRADALEDMLAAAKTQAVLIVVQGMDTAGKDGVIKRGLRGLNPAWVKVAAFKKPSAEEAKQDFLVRIRKELPAPGTIAVFNRSQYEDIAVPAVYGTQSASELESRYARLVAFERELAEKGIRIIKVFLHVSKDVQRERLQRRVDRRDKHWKFSESDLETRKKWDEFQRAYGRILARTSTYWAPWNVIAADGKPARDYAFTRLLRKTLERMSLSYPVTPGFHEVKIPR